MDREAVNELIIKELGKNRTPNEVARMLCEKGLVGWNDAEALVREVKSTHATQIAKKQTPMMLMLVLLGIFAGSLMVIYSAGVLLAIVFSFGDAPAYAAVRMSRFAIGTGPYQLIFLIGIFGTGLGMLAGSLWGSGDVLKTMFKS
jgi:uncharacterized membrane protein